MILFKRSAHCLVCCFSRGKYSFANEKNKVILFNSERYAYLGDLCCKFFTISFEITTKIQKFANYPSACGVNNRTHVC
jgi:hypothetical protein